MSSMHRGLRAEGLAQPTSKKSKKVSVNSNLSSDDENCSITEIDFESELQKRNSVGKDEEQKSPSVRRTGRKRQKIEDPDFRPY